jgi:hypothetical protein
VAPANSTLSSTAQITLKIDSLFEVIDGSILIESSTDRAGTGLGTIAWTCPIRLQVARDWRNKYAAGLYLDREYNEVMERSD